MPPLAALVRPGHPARLSCLPGVPTQRAGELPLGGAWGRSLRMGPSEAPAITGQCRPPAEPPAHVAREGEPRPAGPAPAPPAHTHRDTGATILSGGRSGCGLLGLHRATAATSGNRGEESPAVSAGPGRGLDGGDPHPGAHPAAPTCRAMSQWRTRSPASPSASPDE